METTPAESEPALLTPRQLEVLELMAKGLTNKEIAGVLEISPATVKVHVSAVIQALDVTNRTEAVTRLHELGLGSAAADTRDEFTVEGFGSRPAIAVVPFDNLSPDPQQDFLADGFAEDLITRLAGWRWFPVIARNSTFAYKGRSVDVTEVSRSLGARYVIEGSVRREAGRVRVTVQGVDGQTGTHLWAQQYDRSLADVFEVVDEIVDSVVATLEPALLKLGGLRVLSRRPEQLDAWESAQRATVHAWENSIAGLLQAQALIERATELDPDLAVAHQLSSYCQFTLHLLGHRDATRSPKCRLEDAARKLLELDASDPFAHMAAGMVLLVEREPENALEAIDRAIELGPSVVWARFARAIALLATDRPEEACASLERAIRLSPQDPLLAVICSTFGVALLRLGRVDEAAEQLRRSIREGPGLPFSYGLLAQVHALRGEADEAQALLARMQEIAPGFSGEDATPVFTPRD